MFNLLNEKEAYQQLKNDRMLKAYVVDIGFVNIKSKICTPYRNVDVLIAARTAKRAMYEAQYFCQLRVPVKHFTVFIAKGYMLKSLNNS